MDGASAGVRFRARWWARGVGAVCVAVGLFLVAGAVLDSTLGRIGSAVLVAAAGVFLYVGYALACGYVCVQGGVLTVKGGLRTRHVKAGNITGLELCDAQLFVAGQQTIGVRSDGKLLRLNLLARYPTRAGLGRLTEQQAALSRALAGGPPHYG